MFHLKHSLLNLLLCESSVGNAIFIFREHMGTRASFVLEEIIETTQEYKKVSSIRLQKIKDKRERETRENAKMKNCIR